MHYLLIKTICIILLISNNEVDLVCLSYKNSMHALPRYWALLLDISYIQIFLISQKFPLQGTLEQYNPWFIY